MSTTITADVVQGQIDTANGLLRWIEAESDKTRRAISVTPLLLLLTSILSSIIKKVEKGGIENFDDLHAGYASHKLREISNLIHDVISHSHNDGLYLRIPCTFMFKKLDGQGKHLAKLADHLHAIDEEWQLTVSTAASNKIDLARKMAFAASDTSIDLFDAPEDSASTPTESAIREQFHRTATLSRP